MDNAEASTFTREWADGWNSHDLDQILRHYSLDVVFRSPVAKQIVQGSDGIIRGKPALRTYWAEGLRRSPDLHFDVLDTYVGIDIIVVNYRNQLGRLVCEVLEFDGALVVRGSGTYLDELSASKGPE
jgi:hypothetical protein